MNVAALRTRRARSSVRSSGVNRAACSASSAATSGCPRRAAWSAAASSVAAIASSGSTVPRARWMARSSSSVTRRVRKFRHGGFAGRSCWRVGRLNPCAARRGSTRTNRRDPEDSSSAGDHAEAAVTPPAAKLTVSSTSPTNTRGREHAQALAKAEVSSSLVPVSEGGEA